MALKRGRPLKTIEGLALRVHRILRESGPRNLNIVGAMCKRGQVEIGWGTADPRIVFERVIGILFLRGIVEWDGQKKARRLAART